MTHLRCPISEFLSDSRRLFSGVEEDPFIRERIRGYNYTDQRLAEAVALLAETEQAESGKGERAGQWMEAARKADRLIAAADTEARRHYDFLKLALRNTPGKMKKIFIDGVPNYNKLRLADWFMRTKNLYRRVLADEEVPAQLETYAVTREQLAGVLQKITGAEKAKDLQHRQKGTARDATMTRNKLLDRLHDAVRELIIICIYALEARPRLMEKLGGKMLTPGYKPRKKPGPVNAETETPDTDTNANANVNAVTGPAGSTAHTAPPVPPEPPAPAPGPVNKTGGKEQAQANHKGLIPRAKKRRKRTGKKKRGQVFHFIPGI